MGPFLLVLVAALAVAAEDTCVPTRPNVFVPFPDIALDAAVMEEINATFYAGYQKQGNIPCMSAAVVYGAHTLGTFNFGVCNTTSGARASKDTIFRVASLTKIFTDLASLRVAETTKYGLDTPITELEPRWKIQNPFASAFPITPRNLGSHLAGLYDSEPCVELDTLGSTCTEEEVYRNVQQTQLNLPVNFRPAYSNFGFALLGRALQTAFGMPYEAYVKQHILEPLGMSSSGFNFSAAVVERFAMGAGNRSRFVASGYSAPAGDMYSTTADLSRFISWVLDAAADDEPVSRTAVQSSLTAKYVFEDGNTAIGYPYEMRRYDNYWSRSKDGNFDGFSSSIEIVPELNFGVVALNNEEGMDAHALTQPVVQLLAPIIRRAIVAASAPFHIPDAQRYVGRFANTTAGLTLAVDSYDAERGVLVVSNFNGAAIGHLQPYKGGGEEGTFVFRATEQLVEPGSWGIERGCMMWLFSNVDGTQVVFRGADSVMLVGQAGYGTALQRVAQ